MRKGLPIEDQQAVPGQADPLGIQQPVRLLHLRIVGIVGKLLGARRERQHRGAAIGTRLQHAPMPAHKAPIEIQLIVLHVEHED